MVESVGLAVAVAVTLTLEVVALASDEAVGDAETVSVAVTESVGVAVGTEPSNTWVVVAEMETRVLTIEESGGESSGW
jgi:hypothetical protein